MHQQWQRALPTAGGELQSAQGQACGIFVRLNELCFQAFLSCQERWEARWEK